MSSNTPNSSRLRARAWMVLALTAASIVSSGSAFAELPFRVAGITYSESGPRWAVLELASGKQHLVPEGESINGITVVEITNTSVSVAYDGGLHLLRLAGGSGVTPEADPNAPDITVMTVDMTELRSAVGLLAQRQRASSDAAALNAIFGLPAKSRIVGVDHMEVSDPGDALATLVKAFAEGEPYKLLLSASSGDAPREVYFQPKESTPQ